MEDKCVSSPSSDFNTEASEESKAEAQQALQTLMDDYSRQAIVLRETFKGNTKFSTAEDDQAMAIKIMSYLDQLAFHIHLQSLVCARLDGVNVEGMATEIESFIESTKPKAPSAP